MELTGQDVVKILKACAETGVRELKLGELEVQFGEKPQELGPIRPFQEELGKVLVGPSDEEPMTDDERKALQELEREIAEASLIVEDPIAWQEAELTRGKGE